MIDVPRKATGCGSGPSNGGPRRGGVRDRAPQIGFDRFIRLDWVTGALKVRAGLASLDDLNGLLDAAGLGVDARKKTRTVLNRLWLEPRPELADFAKRGIELYSVNPDVPVPALCWGVAIATYPFFGKVAELVGRLSVLQGDCSAAEVHRRMTEIYGEREGTRRMTNAVLQTQVNWGALERKGQGQRLIRRTPITVGDELAVTWLVEAALRYVGKAVSVSALQSNAVLYPFVLDQSLAYVVSKSSTLDVRSEGVNNHFVGLRAAV